MAVVPAKSRDRLEAQRAMTTNNNPAFDLSLRPCHQEYPLETTRATARPDPGAIAALALVLAAVARYRMP
jgi:hypothetical protein